MENRQRTKGIVLCLIVFALLLRVGFSLKMGNSLTLGDEFQYQNLASNLVNGKGFSGDYGNGVVAPTALKFPGLPAVMALIYSIFGPHPLAARLFQSLLGALLVPLAYAISRELDYDKRVGLLAALGAAIYPFYIFSAAALYPVVISTLLIAVATLLLLRGRKRLSYWYETGAGLVLGAAILCFGHFSLSLPLVAIWIIVNKSCPKRQRWIAGACMLVVCAMIVAPWMVRNKMAVGKLGLSTAFELGVYQGNAEGAKWTSGSGIMQLGDPAIMNRAKQLSEADAAKLYWTAAMDEIRSRPARFVLLSLGKAVNFWRFYPNLSSRPITLLEKSVGILSYGPVLLLGIGWFFFDKPRRRTNILLLIYALATMVPTAVSCSQDRYRMPFDIYLIILASAAIVAITMSKPKKAGARTAV